MKRKTVRKYVASAVASGLLPGGRAKSAAQWAELVRAWFPSLVETRLRRITWPEIDKHRDFIVAMLTAGVTKQTIWQRLRDEHGLVASVSSLKRYIDGNLPEEGVAEAGDGVAAMTRRQVRKPRSITAIWGRGPTRWVDVGGGCGRS